ncbi:MAG: GTP-binding protein [Ilumatobacteraceae bacterium]
MGSIAAERGALRVAAVGSVDDGKSTLIGRLLHDTKSILDDQLAAVGRASRRHGDGSFNLALLTDGLRAEREQGITIDVAYRYVTTAHRSLILADTPGHVQYTRNMVTGASVSDVALLLVDARNGVVEQTRRHAFVAGLLVARPCGRGDQQDGPGGLGSGHCHADPRGGRRTAGAVAPPTSDPRGTRVGVARRQRRRALGEHSVAWRAIPAGTAGGPRRDAGARAR